MTPSGSIGRSAFSCTGRAGPSPCTGRLAPLGITYPQCLVLLVLWEEGKVSVVGYASGLYLDSGTLTPL
jgi:hypothetical protein